MHKQQNAAATAAEYQQLRMYWPQQDTYAHLRQLLLVYKLSTML
jgi:hypothetical protein